MVPCCLRPRAATLVAWWIGTSLTPCVGCCLSVHGSATLTARFWETLCTGPLRHVFHMVSTVIWAGCTTAWTRWVTIPTGVTVPLWNVLGLVLEVLVGTRLATTTPARWKCTGHTPALVLSGDGLALEAFFGKTFLTSPFWLALGMVFAILGPFFFPAPIAVGICASQAPGSKRCSGFDGLGALGTSFWRSFVLTFASQTHTCIGCRGVVAQVAYAYGFVALDAEALLGSGGRSLPDTGLAAGTPHIIGCFFTTNFFRAGLNWCRVLVGFFSFVTSGTRQTHRCDAAAAKSDTCDGTVVAFAVGTCVWSICWCWRLLS